jgi:hypothetical protein
MTDVPTLTSETAANYCVMNPLSVPAAPATLTNGNLTVSFPTNNYGRSATFALPITGKYYWEVTLTTLASNPIICISNASYNSGATGRLGWYPTIAQKLDQAGNTTAYGATCTTGDLIGVAVDMDAGTLTFYKNNVSQGTAFSTITTLLSTTIMPYLQGYVGDVLNVNFGQQPFVYTAPSGFLALNTYNI